MSSLIFDSNSATLPRKSLVKELHTKTSNGVQQLTPQFHSNLVCAISHNVHAITMFDTDNFSLKNRYVGNNDNDAKKVE